ncbi:MAG: glutathione S-transferase family protein [Tagaea sp.]|nr:glutathione S-transferase family protein [Tagaea sp.]
MPILYDNLSSGNAYKVRLMLHKLGLAYTRIEMDIDRGATRTPEFLAHNPDGRIPLLWLDDGTKLPESNAILAFLATGTPLLPEAPMEFAQTLRWLFWEQYSHEPNVATVRYWLTHGVEMTPYRKLALDDKRAKGIAALGVMETHLAVRPFFVADRFTIADIALYAYTHVAEEGGFDLKPYPALRDWLARVADQPQHIPITYAG